MTDAPTPRRTRLGAAAALLGAVTALGAMAGAGPAPSLFQAIGATEDLPGSCDELEHAGDPGCVGVSVPPASGDGTSTTDTTLDDSTSTTVGADPNPGAPSTGADIRAIDAAGAGTVLVAVEGTSLRLVAATPASGWRVEVEVGAGREVEVDFRAGTRRVQVNVELEDGSVRERVRVRDDATGTDIRTEDGSVARDDSSDSSGHGGDDEDRSGHGGDDEDEDDDHSGHGGGDDDDDHGGDGGD